MRLREGTEISMAFASFLCSKKAHPFFPEGGEGVRDLNVDGVG